MQNIMESLENYGRERGRMIDRDEPLAAKGILHGLIVGLVFWGVILGAMYVVYFLSK